MQLETSTTNMWSNTTHIVVSELIHIACDRSQLFQWPDVYLCRKYTKIANTTSVWMQARSPNSDDYPAAELQHKLHRKRTKKTRQTRLDMRWHYIANAITETMTYTPKSVADNAHGTDSALLNQRSNYRIIKGPGRIETLDAPKGERICMAVWGVASSQQQC